MYHDIDVLIVPSVKAEEALYSHFCSKSYFRKFLVSCGPCGVACKASQTDVV